MAVQPQWKLEKSQWGFTFISPVLSLVWLRGPQTLWDNFLIFDVCCSVLWRADALRTHEVFLAMLMSTNTLLKWISKVCCSWGNYFAPALLSGADQQIPQMVGSTSGKPVHFPWGLWCPSTQNLWQKCKSQTQNLCIPFVFTPLWASAVAQKINMWWPRHSSGHELGHWGPQL